MKKLLLVPIALIAMLANAQENILLRGFVYDKDANNAPLGMAAIQIKNTQLGGLTDDAGWFEIPIPKLNLKDSLKASYVGYTPQMVSIKDYKDGDTLRVYISSSAETKAEVIVVAMNARGVLLKAIENMRKNLLQDSLIATGLYRQYHKENGKYVRLLEADLSVAFNTKSIYRYSFHESVQVNQQRRAENYERNADANNHGDHMVDLLKENPFSYNKTNFLEPKNVDFYAPKIIGEDTAEYHLSLQYKESSSKELVRATLWVAKETFAITRMEIEKFPNPYYLRGRYEPVSIWQLVNEKVVVETEKVNGKYVVSSIVRSYNHHVLNKQTGNVDYIVEETFEMFFDDYDTDEVGARMAKGKYWAFTNLYSEPYKYNSTFWKNYDMLDEYPLPEQIKTDLEHNKPLEEQFKNPGL